MALLVRVDGPVPGGSRYARIVSLEVRNDLTGDGATASYDVRELREDDHHGGLVATGREWRVEGFDRTRGAAKLAAAALDATPECAPSTYDGSYLTHRDPGDETAVP